MQDKNIMQNKPPIEIKGVLNRDTCIKLHNFIDTDPIAFKEGEKTIWYNSLHKKMAPPFAQVEHALNTVRFSGQKSVLDYYGEYSYPENTQLVRWEVGEDMDCHSDFSPTADNNKSNQKFWSSYTDTYRTYSGIFYINDDYEGGEIYFPQWDIAIKPEMGSQVIFPSTDDYFHGVKEVRNSKRYTITTWYASDIKYVE